MASQSSRFFYSPNNNVDEKINFSYEGGEIVSRRNDCSIVAAEKRPLNTAYYAPKRHLPLEIVASVLFRNVYYVIIFVDLCINCMCYLCNCTVFNKRYAFHERVYS